MTFETTETTTAETAQTSSGVSAINVARMEPNGVLKIFTADQLEIAEDNQRDGTDQKTRKRQVTDDIKELGALIKSQGLLQNLIGYVSSKKGRTKKIQISGGGRRLTAINWLISEKEIPADFPINVLVVEEKHGLLMSIAENSGRKDMSPANQFKAFKCAFDAGNSIEEISAAFGVDNLTISRRLKLATVEPSIFAEYENGNATLEMITALTLTDDHAEQLQVWNSLQGYQRNANAIRRLLTTDEVNGNTDRVAAYVTVEAYKAAGGMMRQDLFSDSHYLCNAVLLESLAATKLAAETAELEQEGWAWIERITRSNAVNLHEYQKPPFITTVKTPEQAEEAAALEAAMDAADEKLENFQVENSDEYGDLDEEIEESEQYQKLLSDTQIATEKYENFLEQFKTVDPLAKPYTGALATISASGTVEIRRGLIRPDDQKKYRQAVNQANAKDPERAALNPPSGAPKGEHSERLTRQLTAHRTAALQLLTAGRPDIALVTLTHKLAMDVFADWNTPNRASTLQLRIDKPQLDREGDDVKESLALSELTEMRTKWEKLLPIGNTDETMFAWLLKQETSLIMELMAFCVACAINTVQGNDTRHIECTELCQAVDLNMADFWEPTRETYLAQVKKDKVVAIVGQVVSMDAALPMASMPKNDLCNAAEAALAGKGWLPDILKTPPKEA